MKPTNADFILSSILVMFFLLCLAYVGPAIDDHSGENAVAAEAAKQQRQQKRFALAAARICGSENAVARPTGREGEIVCVTKRGFITRTTGML